MTSNKIVANNKSININNLDSKNLAKMIDHTNLNSNAIQEDITNLCEEAIKYGFCSVVISPYYVSYAYSYLNNKNTNTNNIKVCTVVGFPLGYNTTENKINEAKIAIREGASELDMVVNISAVKNGNWDYVYNEIKSIVDLANNNSNNENSNGNAIIVKVIIETGLLNDNEKVEVSKLCKKSNVNFVKTSTGFGGIGGAKLVDIELIKNVISSNESNGNNNNNNDNGNTNTNENNNDNTNTNVNSSTNKLNIKASGGIKDLKTVINMINAGASRIGTSSSVKIINELNELNK
ncbi:MAG: deoxyribose-phosphate aldolase [Methanobacteriaceae archaeon]